VVEKVKKEKRTKILVTGSSGMLGSDLCRELSGDYNVIGMDASKPIAYNLGLTAFIHCDITDRDNAVESIVSAGADLIIHAAAWTDVDGCEGDPDKAERINGEGTGNVAQASAKLEVPLIYISTDFVFDGSKNCPYTEKDLRAPLNIYGKSKLAGEKKTAVLDKYLILRSGWLYGTGGKNFVEAILKKTGKEKEIRVVDDQIGAPTYTKDFAKAIGRLLRSVPFAISNSNCPQSSGDSLHGKSQTVQKIQEVYHISNKGSVSWFEYAKEILKVAGINDVKVVPVKTSELTRPARRPRFSVLDNTKFEKAAGFAMRPWQEALEEYMMTKDTTGACPPKP